jgi:hypothetical protein
VIARHGDLFRGAATGSFVGRAPPRWKRRGQIVVSSCSLAGSRPTSCHRDGHGPAGGHGHALDSEQDHRGLPWSEVTGEAAAELTGGPGQVTQLPASQPGLQQKSQLRSSSSLSSSPAGSSSPCSSALPARLAPLTCQLALLLPGSSPCSFALSHRPPPPSSVCLEHIEHM